MARPRSEHTQLVKEKLIARLAGGFLTPGQRFFSNRAVATQFGVSYQTADRLIRELVGEGWLERRPSAGTYVSGKSGASSGVALVFHERAKRLGSFGARLLAGMSAALTQAGISWDVIWSREGALPLSQEWFPVLWEAPRTMEALAGVRRHVLILNDTPPAGLASRFVDSVACDDFSGGAAAAELLRRAETSGCPAILAGPEDDLRSRQRVAGFRSISERARVFWADRWDAEAGERLAAKLIGGNPSGIFCCSDRLAEGLLRQIDERNFPVVGFDDAPVAEILNLTTIAMPWEEMIDGALHIIRRRMAGHAGAAVKFIFAPMPVIRKSA